VVMQWQGAENSNGARSRPLAFVGKGVTFDTGGISIKPAAGMGDMKWDMAGSAVGIGLMRVVAAPQGKGNAGGGGGVVEDKPPRPPPPPGGHRPPLSPPTTEGFDTHAPAP